MCLPIGLSPRVYKHTGRLLRHKYGRDEREIAWRKRYNVHKPRCRADNRNAPTTTKHERTHHQPAIDILAFG